MERASRGATERERERERERGNEELGKEGEIELRKG